MATKCQDVPFTRTLTKTALTMPYQPRKGGRPTLHWGQRKLLLSEIEFLTLHGDKGKAIVYVGAADGLHIPFLSKLFPDIKMILYDPRDFHPDTVKFAEKHPDHVEIRQQFFMDEDVAEFAAQDGVLFVSDIRTMPDQLEKKFPSDEDVEGDMRRQERWVKEMKPAAYMLKLHLPYDEKAKTYTYLGGDIYFQVWAPISSAETRLIGTSYADVEYDISWYENAMYYFNVCTRLEEYEVPVLTEDIEEAEQLGLPLSYDVKAEQFILAEYLRNRGCDDVDEEIRSLLGDIKKLLHMSITEKYKRSQEHSKKK